jgi:uridine kinase
VGYDIHPFKLTAWVMHILITGASGSGTSTLAAALAEATHSRLLDTDDYFWLPGDPPNQHKRKKSERGAELLKDLLISEDVIVAGSVIDWGSDIENAFDLVVFLYLATEIRLARIKVREETRFGKVDPAFLDWAAQYDAGTADGRSLEGHRRWLNERKCEVLRLEGDCSVEERLQKVLSTVEKMSRQTDQSGLMPKI